MSRRSNGWPAAGLANRAALSPRQKPLSFARKARDRSLALVFAGVLLLLPPIAGISLIDASVAGIPVPILYVFAVWMALIAAAAFLSGNLRASDEEGHGTTPGDGDS